MMLLFIQATAPHTSVNAQEGLDALLMGSAFSECAVLFHHDGVLQLLNNQAPEDIARKDFAKSLGALKDYGVSQVYFDAESANRLQIDAADMVIEASPLNSEGIRQLIRDSDKVLTF